MRVTGHVMKTKLTLRPGARGTKKLVEVGYQEKTLREQVKKAGGRWHPGLQG